MYVCYIENKGCDHCVTVLQVETIWSVQPVSHALRKNKSHWTWVYDNLWSRAC